MSKDHDALNDTQPKVKAVRNTSLAKARNKNSNKQVERVEEKRKQTFGVVVGPKPADGVQYESANARFIATMKKPTKAAARALRVGDLIEIYYADVLVPSVEVVIEPCEKDEDIYSVKTMDIETWNAGGLRPSQIRGPRHVNTDCWVNLKRRVNIGDHDPMMSVYEQHALHQPKSKKKRIEFSLAANTRDGNHILIPLTKKQAALLQLCLPSQG